MALVKNELDQAAVNYALLTAEEAKKHVDTIKNEIRELRASADISKNPASIYKLRELTNSLAWFKANKNRSQHFSIVSNGASMRKANRHPDGRSTRGTIKN